jgi:hypothetical protein
MSDNEIEKLDEDLIRGRIYSIRGFQVMLDRDLAELYGVGTKILNKAVKRNSARFPENFCFKLTPDELESLRFHFGTIENGRGRHSKYLPYVFTEQGVAMLAGILTSETAVRVSIYIMNAFVAMRKFIQSNAQVFKKLEYLDIKQAETTLKLIETDKRVDKIFSLMERGDLKPVQGIFFEGQIFDAYNFISDLFRGAEKSILIIDNYIDDSVLIHLTKVKTGVSVRILTRYVTDQFKLDVMKFEAQYFPVEVKVFPHSHDRFIIIDGRDVYHLGASLKDLGKKWVGFSKFGKSAIDILGRLDEID